MPRLKSANLAKSRLARDIDQYQNFMYVVDSSKFPEPPFRVVVNNEIIEVGGLNREANIFTNLQRGLEGTTASFHAAGSFVENVFTAGVYEELADQEDIQRLTEEFNEHLNDFAKLQFGNRPYVSTEDKTYYIDAVNGNDENDGESPATAFKTWAKVESMIPRILYHRLTIRIIGHLPETISVKGVIIAGDNPGVNRLRIIGDTENASNHEIKGAKFVAVIGTDGGAFVGCMLERVRSNGLIQVHGCTGVAISGCEPRNFGGDGVWIGHSLVRITNCDFGTDIVRDAINAAAVSRVFSRNNVGNATRYGLVANEGSTIFKFGTQPTGSTANEYIQEAGEIKRRGLDEDEITSALNEKVSKSGDTMTGSLNTTSAFPFYIKLSGKKTWGFHRSGDNLYIAPSASNDGTDLDWSKQTVFYPDGKVSFSGIVESKGNTSYTVRQFRNIILSTSDPNVSAMQDGDIWIKYK